MKNWKWTLVMVSGWCCLLATTQLMADEIVNLNQHFQQPSEGLVSWRFVPETNVKEVSLGEHPGLATVWEAGKGQDVQGILKDPIGMADYACPWEFQMSLTQNFDAIAGVGMRTQINYAMGLNVAVTFSAPSTWPQDRTQLPPDTHTVQLLVVHLGSTGESSVGLPQFTDQISPETDLVWERGD